MTQAAAVMALLEREPGRWGRLAREIQTSGSALRVAESRGLLDEGLFGSSFNWSEAIAKWSAALEEWGRLGYRVVTVLDASFPSRLSDMQQLPPFVFMQGSEDARDGDGVAIIGTRRATRDALRVAQEVARQLSARGVVIVSGLAEGIDTAAHRGALDVGGRTVAVVGTGLARTYPRSNSDLQARIGNSGLVLSRFLPDAPPSKATFPMRNELMAAWTKATLVVEAHPRSGARIQARHAVQQGRLLLFHTLLRTEDWARQYVEEGVASFVGSANDVAKHL